MSTDATGGRRTARDKAVGSRGRSWITLTTVTALVVVGVAGLGCVRRTIQLTTEPNNALVFLNDQEIGRSEVSTDFLWYGDYDVVIRKEGYKTLKTNWKLTRPWYQYVPFDFITEVLWAGRIHDVHVRHFELEEQQLPTEEELIERAEQTRAQTRSPSDG